MHRIIWSQENRYPFPKFWTCICGTRMKASVMGPELYREFAQHNPDPIPRRTN